VTNNPSSFNTHHHLEERLEMLTGEGCLYRTEAIREFVLAKSCAEFQVFPSSILMKKGKKPNILHVMVAAALMQLDEKEFEEFHADVVSEHGQLFSQATNKTYLHIKERVRGLLGEAQGLSDSQLQTSTELALMAFPEEKPAETPPKEKAPPATLKKPEAPAGAVSHKSSHPSIIAPRPSNIDPLARLKALKAKQTEQGGGTGGPAI
jgi:hypothetical protein